MTPVVVLDTNVLLAGIMSNRGASFQLLRAMMDDRFSVLLSVPLFCEYEAKLKQPQIMEQHGLSEPDIDRVLDFFVDKALKVSFNFRWRPQLQDPNDEMVLETAVNGGARFIVTFNIKDFRRVAPRFGVAVEPPGAFLQRIKGEGKWDSTR